MVGFGEEVEGVGGLLASWDCLLPISVLNKRFIPSNNLIAFKLILWQSIEALKIRAH